MERPQRRQRLGLLAFAFDGAGRRVLNTLSRRSDLGDALVLCHHLVLADGDGAGSWAWWRSRPGSPWEEPSWSGPAPRWEDGFELAVRDILDVRRWRDADQGVEVVDLLVIAPAKPDDRVELPGATLDALQAIRRRFRLVNRMILLTERPFEVFGEAGIRGKLSPLPFANGEDGDLFDLVLLMGRINAEGRVINDDAIADHQAAACAVHLTAGELAVSLHPRLQSEAAMMQTGGRYVSMGLAEWRPDPELAVRSLGGLLYRRMAGLLTETMGQAEDGEGEDGWGGTDGAVDAAEGGSAAAPTEPAEPAEPAEDAAEADGGGPVTAAETGPQAGRRPNGPPDPWLARLDEAMEAVGSGRNTDEHLARLQRRDVDVLTSLLERQGWSPALLRRCLLQRRQDLAVRERRATTDLALFMRRFAPWYARRQAGEKEAPAEIVGSVTREEWRSGRVIACVAAVIVGLALATYALFAADPWWYAGGAAVMFLVALFLVVRGLQRTYTETVTLPPPKDLTDELRKRRNRVHVLEQLRRRNERALERLDEALDHLRAAERSPREAAGGDVFPYGDEVGAAILDYADVDAEATLRSFWDEHGPDVLEALAEGGAEIPEMLKTFACERCRQLGEVGWGDVYQALGGDASLSRPIWRRALEEARDGAVPHVPVEGQRSFSLLALPWSLPEAMKDSLSEQFPGQVIDVQVEGEAILVVRVTQGFSHG